MKFPGNLLRPARVSLAAVFILLVAAVGIGSTSATDNRNIELEKIGEYRTGIFAEGGSEIVAYDSQSQRLFSVNAAEVSVDILDLSDPANPVKVGEIDASAYGASANSVAVSRGLVAVAIEADPKTDPGKLVFFDSDGNYLNDFTVGALPDMVTFTRTGQYVVVANEGEPNDDYSIDPEGTVSIIRMSRGVRALRQTDVRTVTFTQFNDQPLDPAIRIFGPDATVAQDLEPEYVATSDNQQRAYVTLQENNAIAVIDLRRAEVVSLMALGFKDHMAAGNKLDASDEDGVINIANWPVYGMYQPDGIAAYHGLEGDYLVTANEGDARDYDGFGEEERVEDLTLDATAFPDADDLQLPEALGRLNVTSTLGDSNDDGDFDALYAFGARSFSIWDTRGNLLFDSGDALEHITAAAYPDDFNATNDENDTFDNRSDNKGPEPEGVVVGRVGGRAFAFIGLERIGGVVVYDVNQPRNPRFVQYINPRDFAGDPEADTAGDLGPEGLVFIPRRISPIDAPLLVVGNEISGSVAVYRVNEN